MKKTFFIQLVFLILVIVAAGHLSLINRLTDLWAPYMIRLENYRVQPTLTMLQLNMADLPESERPEYLETLKLRFGYELYYQSLAEVTLTEPQLSTLAAGEPVFDTVSLNFYIASDALRGPGDQVLVIRNMDLFADHTLSAIRRGLLANGEVTEAVLLSYPESEWLALLPELQAQGGIRAQLKEVSQLTLNASEIQRLLKGETVFTSSQRSLDYEQRTDFAYKRIGSSQWVLIQGPVVGDEIHDIQTEAVFYYLLVLSVIILLPVILFFWPFWLCSSRIRRQMVRYAAGDFEGRLPLEKSGVLKPVVTVINQMADRVARGREQVRTFSHAVSHDIRTPLTSLEFSLETYRRAPADKKAVILQRMKGSLEEIRSLQMELLMFSELEQQTADIVLKDIPAETFWQALEQRWSNDVRAERIRFIPAQAKSPIRTPLQMHCALNEHYLTRALDNLIVNALNYGQHQVAISVSESDDALCFRVENDGQPIPEEAQQRIFQPFIRLEESRNRDSGGSGLGLSIVKEIVNAHKGAVRLSQSTLGGACFEVVIPACHRSENR